MARREENKNEAVVSQKTDELSAGMARVIPVISTELSPFIYIYRVYNPIEITSYNSFLRPQLCDSKQDLKGSPITTVFRQLQFCGTQFWG